MPVSEKEGDLLLFTQMGSSGPMQPSFAGLDEPWSVCSARQCVKRVALVGRLCHSEQAVVANQAEVLSFSENFSTVASIWETMPLH